MTKGQNTQSKELLKSLTLDIEGSKLSFDKCIIVKKPERPRYFSDKALDSAKKLAKLVDKDVFRIQLGINYKRIALNQHIVANVDEIIGDKYKSFGTVEGILKAIDLSRNPLFRVYDLLTNKSVRCYFDNQSTSMDMIKKALDKRVAISGLITSREDGEKTSIKVEEIEIFPPEHELPSILEMIGILGGEG